MGADKRQEQDLRVSHFVSYPRHPRFNSLHAPRIDHAEIIGAAMTVLNQLKPGLDEKIYERAMVLELLTHGHTVEQQRKFEVYYKGHLIGTLVPDLIVDGKVLVDAKVVTNFNDARMPQMVGYLHITNLEVALLLNFKEAKLHWKRVIKERRDETADNADMN